MAYTVLATRYRPRLFEEVVGQEDAARVLLSAVSGGRAAHAYLFSGPRGVGKTSMARILAKAWNCLAGETGIPCGKCSVCRAIDEGGDCLDVVEIDGASHNRVENVRELIDTIRFRPVEARSRIYIVDEVHMLSTSAFNALLKTLEEPPAHARFILATTEPLKVPETIRSRCQHIDFRRLSGAEMAERMAEVCRREGVPVPDGLLPRVARHARGGLRDALSLLDQLITYGDGRPTIEAFERLTGRLAPELLHELLGRALEQDAAGALAACGQALSRGARAADLVEQLQDVLAGLLVTVAGGEPAERTPEERTALAALGERANVDQVVAMLDVLVEAAARLRQRHDERLVLELAVVTLARLPLLAEVGEVLASGTGVAAPSRPAASAAPRPSAAPRAQAPLPAPPSGGAAPSAPVASGHAPVATARAATADDFTARFLEEAGRGARSLRNELSRYRAIRLEGDQLVLVLPESGPGALFDPREADVRARLIEAAKRAAGRELQLRVLEREATPPPGASGGLPAGASGAASAAPPVRAARPEEPRPASPSAPTPPPAPRGRDATGDLDARIRGDWPGAEKVDF